MKEGVDAAGVREMKDAGKGGQGRVSKGGTVKVRDEGDAGEGGVSKGVLGWGMGMKDAGEGGQGWVFEGGAGRVSSSNSAFAVCLAGCCRVGALRHSSACLTPSLTRHTIEERGEEREIHAASDTLFLASCEHDQTMTSANSSSGGR